MGGPQVETLACVSSPGKLVVFGEWGVLKGHPALAVALSPRLSTECQQDSAIGPNEMEFTSDGVAATRLNLNSSPLPEGQFFSWASRTLFELNSDCQALSFQQMWGGLRLKFKRDWPLEEGLGSSSAVILNLIRLHDWRFAKLLGKEAPKSVEWERSRALLFKIQGGVGSGIDIAVQNLGRSLVMKNKIPKPLEIGYPNELCLIHTGQKMQTSKVLKERHNKMSKLQDALGSSCKKFLDKKTNWIECIEEHHEQLTRFEWVPDFVQSLRQEWLGKGWIEALKTTGAGGGDALLTWVPSKQRDKLKRDLLKRGWWMSQYAWNAPACRIETGTGIFSKTGSRERSS